jgi:DNA-binding GntR family transcriptional regulator
MKRSLRLKAYENIRDSIVFYDIKPGESILEKDIAMNLEMSRTPVREALLMLENEGLVRCHDRLGYIAARLSSNEVEEYLSLREALEIYAAPKIINRITPAEIKSLEKNLNEAELYAERNDFRNIVRTENDFHEILYRSVKSNVFFRTISGLTVKFQWLRAISLKAGGGIHDSLEGHKAIFKAIANKDLKEFEKAIQLHIAEAKRHALEDGRFVLED